MAIPLSILNKIGDRLVLDREIGYSWDNWKTPESARSPIIRKSMTLKPLIPERSSEKIFVCCEFCDVIQEPERVWLCVACGAPLPGLLFLQGVTKAEFERAMEVYHQQKESISFRIGEATMPVITSHNAGASFQMVQTKHIEDLQERIKQQVLSTFRGIS